MNENIAEEKGTPFDQAVGMVRSHSHDAAANAKTPADRINFLARGDIVERVMGLHYDLITKTDIGEAEASASTIATVMAALRIFVPITTEFDKEATVAIFNGLAEAAAADFRDAAKSFQAMKESNEPE